MATQRKRAVIYCRVSTDKQEQDGESLEYQDAKNRQYAELHDMDIVAVLKEAKSGFIHYSLREKLTLARQFIRDGLADVIIVFDLRRFSRNFVHSAMIFEEIESNGGEIVSVSENIDNSLTGKLIRSILAWSAESERHKIVEYANRRWQTRVEVGLPVGTGRSPYGWNWKDKEKTGYVVNQEQAAVRVSIFHMFVELDMSLRAITHKLTEDRILTPAYAKKFQDTPPQDLEVSIEHCLWRYTTVRQLLKDLENIGVLVVCKAKRKIGQDGKHKNEVHPNRREIPGGIPAIIDPVLYERAQEKLKTNKADKSHLPLNKEDFLLRGHIHCATCMHAMKPRTQKRGRLTQKGTDKSYPFYACANTHNKYKACPSLTTIRTSPLDETVWQECCVLFKRIEVLQTALETEMKAAISALLEDTTGQEQIQNIVATIAYAKNEREKYVPGSYMHNLISQDIANQEEQLARYKEEVGSSNLEKVTGTYQQRIMDFLEFLNVMRGRYEHASFQEKRNALEVLGVRVMVHEPTDTYSVCSEALDIGEEQEWFSAKEAGHFLGVHAKTIRFYQKLGTITNYKEDPFLLVHRDELLKLRERGFKQRNTDEIVRGRIEISYSPRFSIRPENNPTGVRVSLHKLEAINSLVQGWASYYRAVNPSRTFDKLDRYVWIRLRRWLQKKYRISSLQVRKQYMRHRSGPEGGYAEFAAQDEEGEWIWRARATRTKLIYYRPSWKRHWPNPYLEKKRAEHFVLPTLKNIWHGNREAPIYAANRREALKRAKGCCERCGKATKLLTHHKNRVKTGKRKLSQADNRPEMLEAICFECHVKEHRAERIHQNKVRFKKESLSGEG